MADFGWKNGLINTGLPKNTAVSTRISINPWGRSNDDPNGGGRNLHRTDLWYVDFTTAFLSVRRVFEQTPKVEAVYCRSVTLPETRVKPEVFKRDGVPFNMPSWDDPLDAITLVLWMESISPNPVVRFFTDWLALVRAGRGERYSDGFDPNGNEITLDDGSLGGIPYGFDLFSLPFKIWLLQGALGTVPMSMPNLPFLPAAVGQLARQTAGLSSTYSQLVKVTGFEVRGWLGNFKVGDLTYEGSQILTCEAKIYPEYIIQTAT